MTEIVRNLGLGGMASVVLALAATGYFIAGLIRHKHDWKPLVLGFFALGAGSLGCVWELSITYSVLAGKHGGLLDFAYATSCALLPLGVGLAVVMLGGLFTVILRWRNERFRQP